MDGALAVFRILCVGCVLWLLALQPAAAEDGAGTVYIELTGLEGLEGRVFVAVYDSRDTWLGDESIHSFDVGIAESIDAGVVKASFSLPPGEYAFSIFYDENDNGELDTNFIGIPREPVAISNNARPRFGPPKYKDAVFNLGSEALTQQINIKAI